MLRLSNGPTLHQIPAVLSRFLQTMYFRLLSYNIERCCGKIQSIFFLEKLDHLQSKAMQCLAEGCKSEAQQNTVKEALGDDLYAK